MQNKKDLVFEYKGYKAICKWKKGRYWGTFYSPEAPDVALEDWKFAADTSEEAEKRTCSKVEKILEREMFLEKQEDFPLRAVLIRVALCAALFSSREQILGGVSVLTIS